jgi:tetratricopeptide (TPR) repeat protein/serine/threonine protein kinase
VPDDERPDLLVDLVAIHLPATWNAARPTVEQYVEAFGGEYPEFADLRVLPAEVFEADLHARYEFDPLGERRTIEAYAEQYDRPDVADRLRESVADKGGRYLKLAFLGEGGMGAVWKCHDQHLLRLVAVKFPHASVIRTPRDRARLAREARLTAVLSHPGIVPVHEFDESDPARPFYVMRLVTGEPFLHDNRTRPTPSRGRDLLAHLQTLISVCETVAYAHSRNVTHGDLKPGNVKVEAYGQVAVLDWGLSKVHPTETEEAGVGGQPACLAGTLTETSAGRSCGTPHTGGTGGGGTPAYMPPEYVDGGATPAGDIFGLGAILYEILTGHPPFVEGEGETRSEFLKRVASTTFPAPRRVAGRAVPKALQAVCLEAMARRPEDRYASATDLADDLRRWLADEPVRAHREWRSHKVLRLVRRHTGVSLVLTLLLISAAVGAWGWEQNRANQARAADRELDAIDEIAQGGDLERARTTAVALAGRLGESAWFTGQRERARRTLELIDTRTALDRQLRAQVPDFFRSADEAEFHILGAYWALRPHEDPGGTRRIRSNNPRHASLERGIEAARTALGMYGYPSSPDWQHTLTRGAPELAAKLRERAGEILFLWALAVDRVSQGQSPEQVAGDGREAASILDAAVSCGNTSRSLYAFRTDLRSRLGNKDTAEADRRIEGATPDATFLDHHLRGVRLAKQNEHAAAAAAFELTLSLRRADYWTTFRLAKALESRGAADNDPTYLGQAESLYVTCIGLRPDDPTAYNNRGDVLMKLRRFADAAAACDKSIEMDPFYWMAWGNLTLSHAERKDRVAAAGVLKRFIEHPNIARDTPAGRHEHARVLAYVGLACERAGDFKQAADFATESLHLDGDNAETLRNRAIARDKLGQFVDAEADVRKAITLRPKNGELCFVLGNVLANRDRAADAVREYDRAIELQPKLWAAWYNRGVLLRRLGRVQDAHRDQNEVIKNDPAQSQAYFERAILHAIDKNFPQALDDANTFLARNPDDVPGLILRGKIYGDFGKDEPLGENDSRRLATIRKYLALSESDLIRAIKLAPQNPDAYRSRGLTRYRLENWAGAIADYREYLRLAPKARDATGILNDVAVAHENARQIPEALKAYAEAFSIRPTPSLLGNRGNLYLGQGELDRAVADFDAAIHLDKNYSRAWALRGQARMRGDDWKTAVVDFNRALDLFPGHYEMLTMRGFAHLVAGDKAAARKDWAAVAKDRADHVWGKFARGGVALLDDKPADAVEGLAQVLGDLVLGPYATFLLARAWLEIPGPGVARAVKYADDLVRLRPKEAAAFLEAGRVHARAADRAGAADALRDRAIELIGEAVKRQPDLRDRLPSDADLKTLRNDPRFPK